MTMVKENERTIVKLDLNTIIARVILAYDMSKTKGPTIIPPNFSTDPDDSPLYEDEDMYKFMNGNYNSSCILMTKSRNVVKTGGTIILYPERILRQCDILFGSHTPLEFLYGFVVHTVLHEYLHHVTDVKMYLKYRNELRIHGTKAAKWCNEYIEYCEKKEIFEAEQLNELRTLRLFNRMLKQIFEEDYPVYTIQHPEYGMAIDLVCMYFDRVAEENGFLDNPPVARLARKVPRLTYEQIIDELTRIGKIENIALELDY